MFKHDTTETSHIYFVLDVSFKCKNWIYLQNSLSWGLDNTYLKKAKNKNQKPHHQKYKHSFYSFLTINEKGLMPPKHFETQ